MHRISDGRHLSVPTVCGAYPHVCFALWAAEIAVHFLIQDHHDAAPSATEGSPGEFKLVVFLSPFIRPEFDYIAGSERRHDSGFAFTH
jgi:hypothetical protein